MSQYPTQPPPLQYATPAPATSPPRQFRIAIWLGGLLFIGFAVLVFLLLSSRSSPDASKFRPIALSDFTIRLEANQVKWLLLGERDIEGEFISVQSFPDGTRTRHFRTALPEYVATDWPFIQWVLDHRGPAVVSVRQAPRSAVINFLFPLIPWLVIFFFLWLFVVRPLRRNVRQNSGTIIGPGRWVPDPQPYSQPHPHPEANRP